VGNDARCRKAQDLSGLSGAAAISNRELQWIELVFIRACRAGLSRRSLAEEKALQRRVHSWLKC